MPEVHHRCPVVGKVFSISACCASTLLADIPFHCSIERISADNLMNMGRRNTVWFNERVKALDRYSRTAKSKCRTTKAGLGYQSRPSHFAQV